MKKLLLLVPTLLLLTGCIKYGTGEHVGYVFSVDDGIIWDHAWIKTGTESSDQVCYVITGGDTVKSALKEAARTQAKVRIEYNRHLFTISNCANDEITSVSAAE